MLIRRVTPEDLRSRPDQFCAQINEVISAVNKLLNEKK